MDFEVFYENDLIILSAQGEIDYYTAPPLEKKIKEAIEREIKTIIFDFTEVEYLDSAGVALLVLAIQSFLPVGGKIAIVSTKNHVKRILELSGINEASGVIIGNDLSQVRTRL